MPKRAAGCVLAAAALLALAPGTVRADQPFTGTAGTTTLSLTLNPNALLTIDSSVLSSLPSQVSSLLTAAGSSITAEVDGTHATGTRSSSGADLASGHADVTPISLQLAPLSQLLTNLDSTLQALQSQLSLPSLSSVLADVATITGNSTVMGLLPAPLASALTTFNGQLSTLTSELASLPDTLTAPIDQLKSTLVSPLLQGLTADLNTAHPNGQASSAPGITLPPAASLPSLVPSAPEVATLLPFNATAVNAAGAHQLGTSGPQASTEEGSASIDLAPVMNLGPMQTAVNTLHTTLQAVQASIATIQPLLAASAAIINTALPGGLDLSALSTQVGSALATASNLVAVVQSLQLNGLFSCNNQGTGSCSLGSTSVTPAGAGVHAMAASKLVDLALLPMSSGLLSALGAPANSALVDVQGVQATADAFIDGSNGNQTTTSNLAQLSIAGVVVISSGQIVGSALSSSTCQPDPGNLPTSLPIGQPLTLCVSTPAGDVTVITTLGAPQYTYSGSDHRSATVTKEEIRVLNGAPDGTHPITMLGAAAAGTIATVDIGAVSSEVAGASLVTESSSNVTLQPTGMFGPGSLVVGFGLIVGGVALRRVSRRRRPAA